MSERDGWRHVYRYDYSGNLQRQITRGAFPVHQVLAVTPQRDGLLVVASAESAAPYDRLVYRVPIAGGALTRMSTDPGMHRARVSPSGSHYIDGHSARPAARVGRDLGRRRRCVSLRRGRRERRRYARLPAARGDRRHRRRRRDHASRRPLQARRLRSAPALRRHRRDLRRPVRLRRAVELRRHRGEPDRRGPGAAGLRRHGPRRARHPGRGKAFQDATYGRLGQLEIPDHLAALDQAAATRPYMDLGRLGVYGHSWGGYFALRAMLTAPDRFAAGYAGAPGDLTEDALCMEPNLGLLAANPAGYQAGSNLALAGNLRGALKLMHGTSDDQARCPPRCAWPTR
ncbi:prolyl oligopeptidase family serine peptidase [Nannocystis pusilla]|uniref:S9 family peptidase n=1 Tax=Nannocystis pusilla TaxID=889268 RepID=UPI003B7755E2